MLVQGIPYPPAAAAPSWTAGTLFGIDYVIGEALLNDITITDLTTILGGDFDVAYLVPGTGYDMTIDGTAGVRGFGTMLAIGDLLTRLQDMDWAVRVEFNVVDPFIPGTWLRLINGAGDGAEHYFTSGGTFSTDFAGDYNPTDEITHPGHNVIAISNNAAGWEQSVNGSTAVLSAPQTTAIPDFISIAGDVDDTGTINFSNGIYGIIRKFEWFALQTGAELETLSA